MTEGTDRPLRRATPRRRGGPTGLSRSTGLAASSDPEGQVKNTPDDQSRHRYGDSEQQKPRPSKRPVSEPSALRLYRRFVIVRPDIGVGGVHDCIILSRTLPVYCVGSASPMGPLPSGSISTGLR